MTQTQLAAMKHYIRDNLQAIRKSRGLTRCRFAIDCDVSRETIKRIEDGQLPIMITTYKLIDALKLEVTK